MRITSLGHAGFLVETDQAVVVMDPWLSPHGAFDSAWMQLPRNHHLAGWVREKLRDASKPRFLFISHEHEDHFDRGFLESLNPRDFTLVLARFRRAKLPATLAPRGGPIIACEDGQEVSIPGGRLKLFLTDAGLNRDSALLVHADGQRFLNLNDCKIHDRLARLVEAEGPIDAFSAQFSGAIWHPTCYEYARELYAAISRRKSMSKFEAVARALEALAPRFYLAAAGPACFLDPELLHLNFERVNIFPRADKLFGYLSRRLGGTSTQLLELMPGDVLDVGTGKVDALGTERVSAERFEGYVRAYAADFERRPPRRPTLSESEVDQVHARLRAELQAKLSELILAERIGRPLFVSLVERPDRRFRVDFQQRRIDEVSEISDPERYTFTLRAADILKVLDRELTWDGFMLSFRFRLGREPDIYEPLIHGFLACQVEDMAAYCDSILQAESRPERLEVEAGGHRYEIQRYCPHQGADLRDAWIEGGRWLVCPRHRWRFDLQEGGACVSNGCSLRACPIEEKSAG